MSAPSVTPRPGPGSLLSPRGVSLPPSRAILRGAAGAALLAGTWWSLRSQAVQRADVLAGDALRGPGAARSSVDRLVVATTDLGSVYAVLAIGATLAAAGRRTTAADVIGVGLAGWAVSQATKTRVNRARPYEGEGVRRLIAPPTGSSFPSGHAAVATAWSALAAERAAPRLARRLLPAAGAYVALTRVRAGVHYPSDVVGGVGMGLTLAAAWRGPVAAVGRAVIGGVARAAGALAVAAPRPLVRR